MRIFKTMIFMGNGVRSSRDAQILHQILDRALSHLSGMQQGGPGPIGTEEYKEAEAKLEDMAKDIYVALTCKEVVETKEVPYPEKS